MVTLPAPLSYGTVHWTALTAEGQPLTGPVVFTPSVPLVVVAGVTVTLDVVTVEPDAAGELSVSLVATTDLDLNPTGFNWEVDTSGVLHAGGFLIDFDLPVDADLDLSSLLPVDVSTGVITTRGPRGIPGPLGPPMTDAAIAAIVAGPGPTATALTAAFVGSPLTPLAAGADNLAALQAAVNSAAAAGIPLTLRGVFPISGTLLLPSHVIIRGGNGGSQGGGLTTLLYTGATGAATAVVGPANRGVSTLNWTLSGFRIDTGGLAQLSLDLYRVSYSRFTDLLIVNTTAGGVGVILDANVSNACYFNAFDGCKVDGIATGVRFQNGANSNQWEGGLVIACGTAMEFLSLSAGNNVTATDFENSTVKHILVDAPVNVFTGLHMENAPIGYDITANAIGTRRFGTTFASTVTSFVNDASTTGITLDDDTPDTSALRIGTTKITSRTLTASVAINLEPNPPSGTSSAILNLFRNLNTTGVKQVNIYKGDGTATKALALDTSNGNLTLGGTAGVSAGSGYLCLSNYTVLPGTVSGFAMYAAQGALRGKTSAGDVGTILGFTVAKAINYTMGNSDSICLATGGAGGITITLPASALGSKYTIKKVDAGAGAVTVVGSSQNIDGAATRVLAAQYDKITVVGDASTWYIV